MDLQPPTNLHGRCKAFLVPPRLSLLVTAAKEKRDKNERDTGGRVGHTERVRVRRGQRDRQTHRHTDFFFTHTLTLRERERERERARERDH